MNGLPQHCIVCRLMMTPRSPKHIIRWAGTGAYQDFVITFPVCDTHSNLEANNEKLEALIETLFNLRQEVRQEEHQEARQEENGKAG